jgi:hypothetical protein
MDTNGLLATRAIGPLSKLPKASRIQCGEIWSFCHAKQKNVASAKAAPEGAGDIWTWTAIDADSKLIVSYYVGDSSGESAMTIMDDLRTRLPNRVQITTGGHRAYVEAVEGGFGADVDYAQLVRLYGPTITAPGRYSPAECTGIKKRRREGNPEPRRVCRRRWVVSHAAISMLSAAA